jgi:hypothetical protein
VAEDSIIDGVNASTKQTFFVLNLSESSLLTCTAGASSTPNDPLCRKWMCAQSSRLSTSAMYPQSNSTSP